LKLSGWFRTWWFWIGFLLALYTVAGFWVAPWAGKKVLIDLIHEQLGRQARLASLRFNPYTLAVTARGFALQETDGGDFVRFDELYANFQASSLFRWGLTFKQIRLLAPYVRLEARRDGTWNFSDLLPADASPPADEEPEEGSSLIRLLIHQLQLESGELDFVDRTRPTPFEMALKPLSAEIRNLNTLTDQAGPYSLRAVTGEGEVLEWSGTVSLTPVKSSGQVRLSNIQARTLWRYARDQVGFEIRQGALKVETEYALSLTGAKVGLKLSGTGVELDNLRLGFPGEETDLAALLALRVKGMSFDLARRELHVPEVLLRAGNVQIRRESTGDLDWMRLLPARDAPSADPGTPAPASPPFQVRIDEARTEDFTVTFTDATTEPEAVLDATAIDLTVRDLKNSPGSVLDLDLRLRACREGEVGVKGTVGLDPLELKTAVDVSRFPLPRVQPYVNAAARLDLESGWLNVSGDLAYAPQEGAPDLRFTGSVSVDSLDARDRLLGERFVAWEGLEVAGIQAALLPGSVRIESVTARAPYGKVVIAQDGSLNLTDVFGPGTPPPEGATETAAPAPVPHEPAASETGAPEGPMPLEIGVVKIEKGSADFRDLSLIPQVSARIQDLNGKISGLSSANLSRADVALEGKVGAYGTVSIDGKINPLSSEAYTDLRVKFSNVELTTLSPYSGKFTGYIIDAGKLSLDLNYKLSDRVLIGENSIYLDRFAFGQTTDSPDAVKLPVKIAVALLKDVNGVIDVNLPVRGNMDDPEFSLGGVLLKALVNLITKTAASPFNLMGSLVGMDGESLSFVAFSPGRTGLSEEEQAKLEALARALQQRPGLCLEVRGTYHGGEDGRGLREARWEKRLARARGTAEPRGGKKEAELLETLFVEQFGNGELVDLRERFEPTLAPSEGPAKRGFDRAGYLRALRDRLIDAQPLEEAELRQLAMDRATAVKTYLVETAGVEDTRIFILEARPVEAAQEGGVRAQLSLTSR